jgi:subtilisin family serine protease
MKKVSQTSIFRKSFFGIIVLILSLSCQDNFLQTENGNNPEDIEFKSAQLNDFVVITKSETLPVNFENQILEFGEIVKSLPEIGMVVVKSNSANFEKKVAKLNGVMAIVPDIKIKSINLEKVKLLSNPQSIGDDENYFSLQWGLDAIEAPQAWNAGFTGKNARVFLLDTGIDSDHPDLEPNLNKDLSKSFVPGEGYSYEGGEWAFHGSMVAGVVAAANNQLGTIGVAPEAEIVALKVLSEHDAASQFSWIFDAIVYAANNDADVISMSLGWQFNKNGFYFDENNILQKIPPIYIQNIIQLFQRAVHYAIKKGTVVIAAAGNSAANADGNGSLILLPADLENVIAVSATAPDYWFGDLVNGITDSNFDIPAHYTTYGRSIIDLAAPGGDYDYYFLGEPENWWYDGVLTTTEYGWDWGMGSSFSAPHVAGVAALIISKNGGKMDPQKVTQQLLKTADPIDGKGQSLYFGKGRVNAYRAVTE